MIYFIQAGENGPIKIGKSDDPDRRLKDLQTAHYEELRILWVEHEDPGPVDQEKGYHAFYESDHIRGEWFSPNNIANDVYGMQNKISIDIWENGVKHTKDIIFRCGHDPIIRNRKDMKAFPG